MIDYWVPIVYIQMRTLLGRISGTTVPGGNCTVTGDGGNCTVVAIISVSVCCGSLSRFGGDGIVESVVAVLVGGVVGVGGVIGVSDSCCCSWPWTLICNVGTKDIPLSNTMDNTIILNPEVDFLSCISLPYI